MSIGAAAKAAALVERGGAGTGADGSGGGDDGGHAGSGKAGGGPDGVAGTTNRSASIPLPATR